MHPAHSCLVSGILALATLVGCAGSDRAGSAQDAPLSAITDPNAHSDRRIRAIERSADVVAAGEAPATAVRESLKRVAWSRGTWWKIREAAIRQLLRDETNADDTRTMLRLMLPTEDSPQIVALVTRLAGEGRWTDVSGALVRRWARPDTRVSDKDRPERAALLSVFPDRPVEDTVFAVFADPAGDERTRQDAWTLLRRIDPGGRTRDLLANADAPSADPLVVTLRRAASELRCVPDSSEQLAWLRRLASSENAGVWSDSVAAVGALGEAQSRGLALRHLGCLRWAAVSRASWLTASREDLLAQVAAALQGRPRHWRKSESVSGGAGNAESLHKWGDSLAWGDALCILVALEAMNDRELCASLFSQADQDKRDTSTELGGVIRTGGRDTLSATLFPPRPTQRFGDRQFVPSEDMVRAGDTALFHYHFHATTWTNSDYAGPSQGDFDSAAVLGRASLVLTAITDRVLNVDYYQPGGAVIDLGVIYRAE